MSPVDIFFDGKHDCYPVETTKGERQWLRVPHGTKASFVTTPVMPRPRPRAAASA